MNEKEDVAPCPKPQSCIPPPVAQISKESAVLRAPSISSFQLFLWKRQILFKRSDLQQQSVQRTLDWVSSMLHRNTPKCLNKKEPQWDVFCLVKRNNLCSDFWAGLWLCLIRGLLLIMPSWCYLAVRSQHKADQDKEKMQLLYRKLQPLLFPSVIK